MIGRFVVLLVCLACASACLEDVIPDFPREDYEAFRTRTEVWRNGACGAGGKEAGVGTIEDLTGRWLVRALLEGGLDIGLRMVFTPQEGHSDSPPSEISVDVWLDSQSLDEPPLLTTLVSIAQDGTFDVGVSPLNLGKENLNLSADVIADVLLKSQTVDGNVWCGIAEGAVNSPIRLSLEGSTFSAQRETDAFLVTEELPFECPGDPCAEGGSNGPSEALDAEVGGQQSPMATRPASPDLTAVPSERLPLTGDWLLKAEFIGQEVLLWVSLFDATLPNGGGRLDGAMRTVEDDIDSPARAYFSAVVDPEGRFEVWLPDFTFDAGEITVAGDLLLGAATEGSEGWCGLMAGQVRNPVNLTLPGIDFAASRWVPGETLNPNSPSECGRTLPNMADENADTDRTDNTDGVQGEDALGGMDMSSPMGGMTTPLEPGEIQGGSQVPNGGAESP